MIKFTCWALHCVSKPLARGLCPKHYRRVRYDVLLACGKNCLCWVDGCDLANHAHQLCKKHYNIARLFFKTKSRRQYLLALELQKEEAVMNSYLKTIPPDELIQLVTKKSGGFL